MWPLCLHQRPGHWQLQALGPAQLLLATLLSHGRHDALAVEATQYPLAAVNPAVLQDLKQLNKQRRLFGGQDAPSALVEGFQAVQAQLGKVELLVKLGQYDGARLQLREEALSKVRMDLAYGQEMYAAITPQMGRDAVMGLERLDGMLKRQEPPEAIKPVQDGLSKQLQAMVDLLDALTEAT